MCVIDKPDGHPWGREECLPNFVVIKIPDVAGEAIKKYLAPQYIGLPDANGVVETYRRRLWQIRWTDLPQAVKDKLATGVLTIKAGTYSGPYDYTWAQIKGYFRNLETGLDETADLA